MAQHNLKFMTDTKTNKESFYLHKEREYLEVFISQTKLCGSVCVAVCVDVRKRERAKARDREKFRWESNGIVNSTEYY